MAICKDAPPARNGQLHSVMGFGSFLLLTAAGSCWAHRAVPERYNGFVFNGAVAQGQGQGREPVVWEAFMDPMCHNCKRGWPVVSRVAERYGSSLVTIVHPFPAPPGAAHCADDECFPRVSSLGAHLQEPGELGISTNAFEAGFNDAATDEATRVSFKYGCSRGVVGTTTFLANGMAVIGANDGWSEDDWAKIFDPVLNTPNT